MNDTLFEEEERFRLVLGSHSSESAGGGFVVQPNSTTIIIEDNDRK